MSDPKASRIMRISDEKNKEYYNRLAWPFALMILALFAMDIDC